MLCPIAEDLLHVGSQATDEGASKISVPAKPKALSIANLVEPCVRIFRKKNLVRASFRLRGQLGLHPEHAWQALHLDAHPLEIGTGWPHHG